MKKVYKTHRFKNTSIEETIHLLKIVKEYHNFRH